MSKENIKPHKITKPIQLLGAWLTGLVFIDGIFLGSAIALKEAQFERLSLVIAAIINVPVFITAIFILQTRFRPELQEDTFYHKYINQKNSSVINVSRIDIIETRINALQREVERRTAELMSVEDKIGLNGPKLYDPQWLVGLNQFHPDFLRIKDALKNVNITISVVFGEDATPKIPSKWIVSLNEEMDLISAHILLSVVTEFNFDGFVFWAPFRELEPEDVYIGSYGKDEYVPFDRNSIEIIKSNQINASLLKTLIPRKYN